MNKLVHVLLKKLKFSGKDSQSFDHVLIRFCSSLNVDLGDVWLIVQVSFFLELLMGIQIGGGAGVLRFLLYGHLKLH